MGSSSIDAANTVPKSCILSCLRAEVAPLADASICKANSPSLGYQRLVAAMAKQMKEPVTVCVVAHAMKMLLLLRCPIKGIFFQKPLVEVFPSSCIARLLQARLLQTLADEICTCG